MKHPLHHKLLQNNKNETTIPNIEPLYNLQFQMISTMMKMK